MQDLPFTSADSWALWDVPAADLSTRSNQERQRLFGTAYQAEHFPKDLLNGNLEQRLRETHYVLVGINPNYVTREHLRERRFLNFHGRKGRLDYRLAAAVYGTPLWGTFMTDLSSITPPVSRRVRFTAQDVAAFEQHLDQLGIPATSTLIALGPTAQHPLAHYAHRPVASLHHYAGVNGSWDADAAHQQIMAILQQGANTQSKLA